VAEMSRGRQIQLLAATAFVHELHNIYLMAQETQNIPILEELQSKSTREMAKSGDLVKDDT
jgi:hypothetical protein